MGGGALWQLLGDAPDRLLSATFVAPVSPYGFGGTKDAAGSLCAEDAAGSGGGVANPQYSQMLRDGDRIMFGGTMTVFHMGFPTAQSEPEKGQNGTS